VQQAVEYESRRQIDIIEGGGTIVQETRLFDTGKGVTRSMRSKEEADDYRYFPDPDLMPLEFDQAWVDGIKATLPELPDDKKARFIGEYGLSAYDAGVLVSEKDNADFYESVVKGGKKRDPKQVANWVTGDFFAAFNKAGVSLGEFVIDAAKLGGLIDEIASGTVSNSLGKQVFAAMLESGKDAAAVIEEKGLRQVTDTGAIEAIVDTVLAANADKVAEYRSGKDKLFGFFVGQAMKAMGGKANPAALNDLLKKKLSQ
jgi:aspartyl-tRNA(Asn)/glutamyl-tRNA(Gln) amidotransferase subunit B